MLNWNTLTLVSKDLMVDARLQLHWAAQIPASIGYSFVEPEEDWSHVSLSSFFSDDGYLLVSQPAKAYGGFRLGIRLADLTLVFLDDKLETRHAFALSGHCLEDGYDWLKKIVQPYLQADSSGEITRPDHELPPHPVAEGALFSAANRDAFQLLSDWYANAEHILQVVVDKRTEASRIRCWPHHFDMATLLRYDKDTKDPEEARSMGIGFVPGDSGYDEPYVYVTPWPYPENPSLPELSGGHWHQEGWFGAVLVIAEVVDAGDTQEESVIAFIDSAVKLSKAL